MDWLGWAMWQRCPRACDWDVRFSFSRLGDDEVLNEFGAKELCHVDMWPLHVRDPAEHLSLTYIDAEAEELNPRCVKKDWFAKAVLNI
jgi:hypothetical protein